MTKDNQRYMTPRTLNQLEERLDPLQFFRVNRMHLISYESINRTEPYLGNHLVVFLKSASGNKIIVSREKVSEFKSWLNQ
jgi:DNA-binding LytR/AlgR family response regulator